MFSLADFFLLAQFWHFFHWKNRNASQARVYLCVWVYIERQNLKHHTKLVESTYVCFLTEAHFAAYVKARHMCDIKGMYQGYCI